jgi:glutamate racemase
MNGIKPVFIADTCIGGLSVVRSLWRSGHALDAVFMADYAINPLGIKSDAAIGKVVNNWLKLAAERSDTLVMACNTLSIRHRQLVQSGAAASGLKSIISMADCFEAMVNAEADRLANRKVLVIGTEFTASQDLYPDMLKTALPGTRVSTMAATDLERRIARFQQQDGDDRFSRDLSQAIAATDIAVLACTCFPMVRLELESRFPGVTFLDPGAYCSGLLNETKTIQARKLSIRVSGDVVSKSRVIDFARSYLNNDAVIST